MELSRLEYWSGQAFPSPGDLSNPGIEPRSPALQADSLPAKPQGKPKNAGVGRLSLLQWIFLTKEWNWGLLHCRQILYQLTYQGSLRVLLAGNYMASPRGGNGNPLQCSSLENPVDRRAWWAAVDGVAQSWTRLK